MRVVSSNSPTPEGPGPKSLAPTSARHSGRLAAAAGRTLNPVRSSGFVSGRRVSHSSQRASPVALRRGARRGLTMIANCRARYRASEAQVTCAIPVSPRSRSDSVFTDMLDHAGSIVQAEVWLMRRTRWRGGPGPSRFRPQMSGSRLTRCQSQGRCRDWSGHRNGVDRFGPQPVEAAGELLDSDEQAVVSDQR